MIIGIENIEKKKTKSILVQQIVLMQIGTVSYDVLYMYNMPDFLDTKISFTSPNY